MMVSLSLAADAEAYARVLELRQHEYAESAFSRIAASDDEHGYDRRSWVYLASYQVGDSTVTFGSGRALPLRYFEPEIARILPVELYFDIIDALGDRRDRTIEVARVVSTGSVADTKGVFVNLLGAARFLIDRLGMNTIVAYCAEELVDLYRAVGVEVLGWFDYCTQEGEAPARMAAVICDVPTAEAAMTTFVGDVEFEYVWPEAISGEPHCLWAPEPPERFARSAEEARA